MPRPIHFDIHGDDPQASVSFYSDVFDWQTEQWGDMPYWLQRTGDGPGIDGGIAATGEPEQAVILTMEVDDVDAFSERVVGAGGAITAERSPIPGVGWFVMATDPNGVYFGMLQPDATAGA